MKRLLLSLLILSSPAVADETALVYSVLPEGGPEAFDLWSRELPGTVAPLVFEAQHGTFTATQLFDQGRCQTFWICPTRVYDAGIAVFDGQACTDVQAHRIDADRRTFSACGKTWNMSEGGGDE